MASHHTFEEGANEEHRDMNALLCLKYVYIYIYIYINCARLGSRGIAEMISASSFPCAYVSNIMMKTHLGVFIRMRVRTTSRWMSHHDVYEGPENNIECVSLENGIVLSKSCRFLGLDSGSARIFRN
jgi:hypothetical protein